MFTACAVYKLAKAKRNNIKDFMQRNILTAVVIGIALVSLAGAFRPVEDSSLPEEGAPLYPEYSLDMTQEALAARFAHLSVQGTNSCGGGKGAVSIHPEDGKMQGSCCGAMTFHSYEEQLEGLKAYAAHEIIPPDPYDVEVRWAKEMIAYAEATPLTAEQQAVYDKAVTLSHEGGPCCCKCWHWYAYEGLAKHLIINENFSAEEIAKIWDLSDACGGDHAHH